MAEAYTKPALTYEEQLQLLKDRGLIVANDDLALSHLKSINYYRLSVYWYPFRKREQNGTVSDCFEKGANFDDVIELYEFDRSLRLLVMDAIEQIEVRLRSLFAYRIGHVYGAFGHTEATSFRDQFNHEGWLEKLETKIIRHRNQETFITHYNDKYTGFPRLPIWAVTEVMSLGELSRGYNGLKYIDKNFISDNFARPRMPINWFHTLTFIRNICSHHGRLWNRELSITPSLSRIINCSPPVTIRNDRIFYVLLIIRHLLPKDHIGNEWKNRVENLIDPIANENRWRASMGMPEDWKNHPVWK